MIAQWGFLRRSLLVQIGHCRLGMSLLTACGLFGGMVFAQERSFPAHVDQKSLEQGKWKTDQIVEAGRVLFSAKFTRAEGAGRPATTGRNIPRSRRTSDLAFARSIGPDANSCAGCHNDPVSGGSGDFVANVFVGLGDPAWNNMSLSSEFSAERGTPDLFGTGIVELLAREITADLHAIRDSTIASAKKQGKSVQCTLESKGIHFGSIVFNAFGEIESEELEGIDRDLIIKPFTQKGTVVSLREFTVNALNLHHGMQATERFGLAETGSEDFDEDGIQNEITNGDATALSIYQASLRMPGVCLPRDPKQKAKVDHGKLLFQKIRCAGCHVPELELRSPVFHEPSPFNVFGTLSASNTKGIDVDLAPSIPALRPNESKFHRIPVYTDFKRHVIADEKHPHFNNETVEQRMLPTSMFLTKRLWSVGNTAPYGHRGDLTTIRESILAHGGEAADSCAQFEALGSDEQESVVLFLKSLQILPAGAGHNIEEESLPTLPYDSETDESSR